MERTFNLLRLLHNRLHGAFVREDLACELHVPHQLLPLQFSVPQLRKGKARREGKVMKGKGKGMSRVRSSPLRRNLRDLRSASPVREVRCCALRCGLPAGLEGLRARRRRRKRGEGRGGRQWPLIYRLYGLTWREMGFEEVRVFGGRLLVAGTVLGLKRIITKV